MRETKKDFRKFLLAIALVLSVFAILPFTSALGVINMSSPIQGGNYSGIVNFSAMADFRITGAGTGADNSYNITLYCNASGGGIDRGANSVKVATIKNSSATSILFENAAVSITGLTDGMTYNCSAYADNYTTQGWINTAPIGGTMNSSGITFDSTAPSCSASTAIGLVYLTNPQTLVYSSSDAVSLVSTVVNISGPSSFGTTSLPVANQVGYTLDKGNSTYTGSYTITVQALDRTGNVCTSTAVWKVGTSGGSAVIPETATGQEQGLPIGVLLVIAGIIVAIVIFSKKK